MKVKILLLSLATILLTIGTAKMALSLVAGKSSTDTITQELKVFSNNELRRYSGERKEDPIYLAYEGLVYDVSPGRKFYEPGGAYHFLAGRDSTIELKIAGGGIIKDKYKVIGKLVN